MSSPVIEAIIFDYGKTLCLPQSAQDALRLTESLAAGPEKFWSAYAEFRPAYDRGDLNDADYWSAVARACDRPMTSDRAAQLAELDMRSWTRPNLAMTAWARALRDSGRKTAILSNMQTSLRQRLAELCPWLPEFDCAIFSSDIGVIKPDPEIYRRCLATLNVAPDRALFVDDLAENVAAAERLGVRGIIFSSNAALHETLSADFSASLPPFPP
jgi:putative hydrolase of the HAD superfamily